MEDSDCVEFLRWALPRLRLRGQGFRRVRRQVCKRIGRRLRALGLADAAAYRACLDAQPAEWSVLDGLCRITISRFYRDPDVFAALERAILPGLARLALARNEIALRVWSAGCGSGEEPYTLALLWRLALKRRFPALGLNVLATDADPALLARARRACYPYGSLRDLPEGWRHQAFRRLGEGWCLRPEYRAGIRFLQHDVRRSSPPGPFHMVLCRNLALTYFETALQREILARIRDVLVPGGVLVVGAREILPQGARGFVPVSSSVSCLQAINYGG